MELTITRATVDEAEETQAFYDKVTRYLEEHINYPMFVLGEYPAMEHTMAAITTDTMYICRDENGTIVGATKLNDDPEAPYADDFWTQDLADGEYMVIHRLCADPDLKGTGL